MPARHESGRRAVLDVAALPVGTNQLELSAVLAGAEKYLPRRLELGVRLFGGRSFGVRREEFVEPTAAQLRHRQAEQSASGWIRVDEDSRVVDNEHGVVSGR